MIGRWSVESMVAVCSGHCMVAVVSCQCSVTVSVCVCVQWAVARVREGWLEGSAGGGGGPWVSLVASGHCNRSTAATAAAAGGLAPRPGRPAACLSRVPRAAASSPRTRRTRAARGDAAPRRAGTIAAAAAAAQHGAAQCSSPATPQQLQPQHCSIAQHNTAQPQPAPDPPAGARRANRGAILKAARARHGPARARGLPRTAYSQASSRTAPPRRQRSTATATWGNEAPPGSTAPWVRGGY